MSKLKKRLQGHIKTKHFQKRQLEREVSDQQIVRAFKEGVIKEVDGKFRIIYEQLSILLDLENNALITVLPGDLAKNKPKILSKEEARNIKILIETRVKQFSKTDAEAEDEFAKFIKENAIIKL